ncbi:MAG: molybdopterin-dependent oxidoreductase [Methanoregula sp.]|nr:molybdopterin-dependent oxidoreductase [Methanoregula sp.]
MNGQKILTCTGIAFLLVTVVIITGCTTTGGNTSVTDPAVIPWQLTLNGTSEKVLTLDDLRRLPAVTGHGYAVSTTGIRFGPYTCTGVDLRDLIADVGGYQAGDEIWISAPDGYLWVFDTDQLEGKSFVTFNTDLKEIPSPPLRIILMYEQDNKPVSYDDGGPARIAIISDEPGTITEGSAWIKWVNRIEVHRK